MKQATIIGRLTREPIAAKNLTYPRALATCACTVLGQSAQRTTEYVDLIIDGNLATTMLTHGKEGDLIAASGNESLKTFTRRDKTDGTMNEIYVTAFEFLTSSLKQPQKAR